jgi:hypothetical protein
MPASGRTDGGQAGLFAPLQRDPTTVVFVLNKLLSQKKIVTRTDKNLCRCFGAPARRVFPDHLITLLGKGSLLRNEPQYPTYLPTTKGYAYLLIT